MFRDMTRKTYIWRDGKMVEINNQPRTESKAPYVISDTMDAAVHPCNGLWYESKSSFRKTTRAHGCTEVGNEVQKDRRQLGEVPGLRKEIVDSFRKHGGT